MEAKGSLDSRIGRPLASPIAELGKSHSYVVDGGTYELLVEGAEGPMVDATGVADVGGVLRVGSSSSSSSPMFSSSRGRLKAPTQ